MRQPIDITGQQFGRLTVICRAPREIGGKRPTMWRCVCSCGTEKMLAGHHLSQGRTKSCGCLNREVTAQKNRDSAKHGMWRSNEFGIWQGMLQRCSPTNVDACKRRNYAERGVTVCERWRNSFEAFYSDIGPRPSRQHSLDRFPDQQGSYEPGNVRWATPIEQGNNRRNNIVVDVGGEKMTLAEFARKHGLTRDCVYQRLKRGVTGDALAEKAAFGRKGRVFSEQTRARIAEGLRKWWASKKRESVA